MIARLLVRDLRRSIGGSAWLPIAFFVLVAALVPFAVGPDAPLLARIGPGILWIAALTAALMPIERLVEPDRADGILDQLTLAGLSEEAHYELPMTQEQMGDALGLTPVHVNRVLRALETDGLITRRKRQIGVVDWCALRDAAEFNERYLHLTQTRS